VKNLKSNTNSNSKLKFKWARHHSCLNLSLIFALVFSAAGCYEPTEGCLDIAATNFDVTADENCCCIYPELTFSINHLADTVRVSPDSIYHDIAGNPYKISYFQFYFSDIRLVRSDGSFEQVADTLKVYYVAGQVVDSVELPDDFTLINLDDFSFPAGVLRATGDFEKIVFRVGIGEPVLRSFPSWFEPGHPLSENELPMWDTLNGYYSIRAGILRDTSQPENVSAVRIPAMDQSPEIQFMLPITAVEGFDTVISFKVDYLKWLEGINVLADSELEIIQKIVSNTPNAISID
jgi:hypothetical protein